MSWNWASGTATGKVVESFTDGVERTIKGAKIKRKASKDEPAYLVEQKDGDKVLKSHSELTKAS
ncbi:hypervirulence associated TUDOR domain-containing protein [Aliihoeflea sp. PC F10.4]